MKYLLDTNVISELRKPRPDSNVMQWIKGIGTDSLFLSCLTIGELKYGAAKKLKQDEQTGKLLVKWINTLIEEYEEQIVDIDLATCERWAELLLINNTVAIDSLLAAQALANGMILVTRNTKHLATFNIKLINPFEVEEN